MREIEKFPRYIQVFDEQADLQPSLQAVWQSCKLANIQPGSI